MHLSDPQENQDDLQPVVLFVLGLGFLSYKEEAIIFSRNHHQDKTKCTHGNAQCGHVTQEVLMKTS